MHPGGPAESGPGSGPAVALVTIIAWLIGDLIRQAQARAELVRAQTAAQTGMAERLRIARELHDIVAHSIGIIAIQAGSGRGSSTPSPDEARDALAAIEATGRDIVRLRRMVTGLRRADPEPGPGQAPLGPAPGLADIERLAATTLDAGVQVDVDWRGSREPLPADIDLSAFRIIQEAVTNVVARRRWHRRVPGCGSTSKTGSCRSKSTTAGAAADTAGTGYGITGMRERAALLGGDFSAAPRPGGGFRVVARLPVPGRDPMTIQVILADNQPLVRAGLRMLMAQTPDIDVVGEAVQMEAEAVQLARHTSPDVVVMDIRMPGMDGIEATQMITAGDAPRPRARAHHVRRR